ncbi:MAG: hypothetical protein PF447_13790 [Spirochaetaceae bacterium]|jgi:hypothetical protein|nr:hypothetical protein [Spirochaetaceae bacterium]
MKITLLLCLFCLCCSCVLFGPQRQIKIPPPPSYTNLEELPQIYELKYIHQGTLIEHWTISADQSVELWIPKEGLSAFIFTPRGYPPPFQPYAQGLIIDPMEKLPDYRDYPSAVTAQLMLLLHNSPEAESFNYLRFLYELRERLGIHSWNIDLTEVVQRINNGSFNARYIKSQENLQWQVIFPPGLWICEDPGVEPFELLESQSVDISLPIGAGLRYLDLKSNLIREFFCDPSGRLLWVDRHP